MKLGPIALKLRIANTRFGDYIGGAAEFAYAWKHGVKKDVAYVLKGFKPI